MTARCVEARRRTKGKVIATLQKMQGFVRLRVRASL
jgi:hypothetical protein